MQTTSLLAYESIQKTKHTVRDNILELFDAFGAMSDYELITLYKEHVTEKIVDSTVRTRRSELVDEGLLRDSGLHHVLPTGREAIVWEVV